MILNDDGTYDSMSEGEMEALEQVAMHRQVNNDDGTYNSMIEDEIEAIEQVAMHRRVNEDEDDQVYCDEDTIPALFVSKVLTLQHQQEDQRCHIFHTKAGING